MNHLIIICTLAFIASAEQDLATIAQQLEEKLPTGVLSGLPSINEGEDLFKQKCLKNGNNETYERAMEAKAEFQTCLKSYINIGKMQEEIEKAKPTGDLDLVFRRYCSKAPSIKDCVVAFTNGTEPCLDEKEKSHKDVALNITESLINFICYKDGDRIALFVAEGGPECLQATINEFQNCVNETMSQNEIDPATLSVPEIVLDEKQCRDIFSMEECMVKHLELCKQPTPANIVSSLFTFVKKRTPCGKYNTPSSAIAFSATVLSLLLPSVAYFLSKVRI